MEPTEVRLSEIELLRSNNAWKYLNQEWKEILEELQATLIEQDYPVIYRTQGRASALALVLGTLDQLEDLIKESIDGRE